MISFPPVFKSSALPKDFREELARANLPRMKWLLITSTMLSLVMVVYNAVSYHRAEFVPWQILDVGGSLIFLVLFLLAAKGRIPSLGTWLLSPAYFAFWLVLMDGYYFAGRRADADIASYVLGALAPAVLIILPPRVFLALLIPNHLIFCVLTVAYASRGHISRDMIVSELLNGTLGVLIAGLGAWFLFAATRSAYDKTRQVLDKTKEVKLAVSHLQAILENIPFQAWLKDTEGRFLAINREFSEEAGLPRDNILGKTSHEIYPESRSFQYVDEDTQIIEKRERLHFEESRESEGNRRWFEVFKSPVLAEDGTCIGTAGVAWDITERKEIEERLVAADTAKSDFLATMSHEIRTPMNSVLGYAELLRATPMSESQREYVASIAHSGQLLLSVINDILDFSKIEAGMVHLQSEVFSLDDLLARMMAMFKPLAAQKGLSFRFETEREVPSTMRGDASRLEQLLANLLSNAVKFTNSGEVQLLVKAKSGNEASPEWSLSFQVTDTGIGIPPEQVDRLFKPFSQVDSAMARRFSGTGLGLVIVERLCHLMNGTIEVESRYGRGSSFTAILKLSDAEGVAPQNEMVSDNPLTESDDLSACRILVVEDNVSNRKLMASVLARWGIRAELVEGGEEAIRRVQRERFDLILMDVQMPGMDGLVATRLIREWEAAENRPRVYIAALTAFAMADDSARCFQAGMDDYLTKPLNIAALREVVAKVSRGNS